MQYVYSLPTSKSLDAKGYSGHAFGPLTHKDIEVHYITVTTGHDTFQISRQVIRLYYILSGSGYFTINAHHYPVDPGVLVEIPPGVEYSYSGAMEMLAFSTPHWFSGNDKSTRWNPAVVGHDSEIVQPTILSRVARRRVLGKSPANAYLRLNRKIWESLPPKMKLFGPVHTYGKFLHKVALGQRARAQARSTFFLRNRPALTLLRDLIDRMPRNETVRIAVLGCSTGAEVYSVVWATRSARPDLTIVVNAVDISPEAVEIAREGKYSLEVSSVSGTAMLERMSTPEIEAFFERQGDVMNVKAWLRSGIEWHVGDVTDPSTLERLGPQDIVVASNFLCHMEPADAETCLRHIGRLVRPHGFLFVTGIDLDVRSKVARSLEWTPVQEQLEAIHNGDPVALGQWPYHYAGLEPLDKRRADWRLRYAAVFEMPEESVIEAHRSELLYVPEHEHAGHESRSMELSK